MPSRRSFRRRFASGVLLALVAPCGACYSYVNDSPGASLAPDTDVRVDIDPLRADRIATALGPRVQTLDGHTVAADDTTLSVSVRTITRQLGNEERWNGDIVRIPREAIARVARRRFDAIKTTLIAGGIAGAAIVAAHGGTSAPTAVLKGGPPGGQQ